jgi:Asp-tRNA(Asn)/Glu-tRNA(Gln) amidotransferase A subunit family amidase
LNAAKRAENAVNGQGDELPIAGRVDIVGPHGRLDGPKPDQTPVAMEFLGRQFDEAVLFEIASAYEAGTKHRRPPKGFGPLAGEP